MKTAFSFALSSALLASTAAADVELSVSGSVEAGDSPAAPGDFIQMEYVVSNSGSSEAEDVPIGFYFSTDTTFDGNDIFIEAEDVSLDEFDTESESEQITLPGSLPNGQGYILIYADYLGVFTESNEANNVAAAPITIVGGTVPDTDPVGFEGRVQSTSGGFSIDGSPIQLTSAPAVLGSLVGQYARIEGQWEPGSNEVAVTSAQAVEPGLVGPQALVAGGTATFQVSANAGDAALVFFSGQSTFAPYNGAADVVFLGALLQQSAKIVPASGVASFAFPVPQNPALSGVQIYGQAATSPFDGTYDLTNPWTATL